jgi:hypothetical protein
MNESIVNVFGLGLACLAAALLGALIGGAWASRSARIQARQQADQVLQQALQRVPQLLQQSLQVELELMVERQAQRELTLAQQQERWQVEQVRSAARNEERYAAQLHALTQAVAAKVARPTEPSEGAAAERPTPSLPPRVPPPNAVASRAPAVSARPPELLSTPLPRPKPLYEDEAEPLPEPSDAELDALPPELPAAEKPRKRILRAPKKPTLHSL